jgi:hypothetical protein
VQRLHAGAERGDAEALHVRCVLVEQRDPLAEREPTEQIVDALAHRQRGGLGTDASRSQGGPKKPV